MTESAKTQPGWKEFDERQARDALLADMLNVVRASNIFYQKKFAGVADDALIMHQEPFGPVAPIASFASFDEAVAFWRRKGGSPEILDQVLRAYRIRNGEISELAVELLPG